MKVNAAVKAIGTVAVLTIAVAGTAGTKWSPTMPQYDPRCPGGSRSLCGVVEECRGLWFWERCRIVELLYHPLPPPPPRIV